MNQYAAIAHELSGKSPALPPDFTRIQRAMSAVTKTLFPSKGTEPFTLLPNINTIFIETNNLINDAFVASNTNHSIISSYRSREITDTFLAELPRIQQAARDDIEAALRGDPAARDAAEVIQYYPGFTAVLLHRIAHVLHALHVPYVPRGIAELAHKETGVDIHPGAVIGNALFIDHGTGVVIGETAVIGNDVKIYQGVTLGALSLPKDNTDKSVHIGKRHPTIEDGVTIYANATILGGSTIVGRDSIIGANTWIKESIPPFSRVGNDPQIIVKTVPNPSFPSSS